MLYSDVDINGSALPAIDLAAIKGSIEILIGYAPFQRLFNPRFGCQLDTLLFELISTATAMKIKTALMR